MRRLLFTLTALLLSTGFSARAEEVSGTLKSIDAKAKTLVVATGQGASAREVTVRIDDKTVAENRKGKARKKFPLDRLAVGGSLDVTVKDGVASKIVLGKGALKKKEK